MEIEPRQKNSLEELQKTITDAASDIETELDRTANDWLSCFGSVIFRIEIYLHMRMTKKLLPEEKHQQAQLKLGQLKERLHKLKKQYPEKETVPPDEIKQELLDALNILK